MMSSCSIGKCALIDRADQGAGMFHQLLPPKKQSQTGGDHKNNRLILWKLALFPWQRNVLWLESRDHLTLSGLWKFESIQVFVSVANWYIKGSSSMVEMDAIKTYLIQLLRNGTNPKSNEETMGSICLYNCYWTTMTVEILKTVSQPWKIICILAFFFWEHTQTFYVSFAWIIPCLEGVTYPNIWAANKQQIQIQILWLV